MCRTGSPMAGTKKTGRLYSIGSYRYVGERVNRRGRIETKKFGGTSREALQEWGEWAMAGK